MYYVCMYVLHFSGVPTYIKYVRNSVCTAACYGWFVAISILQTVRSYCMYYLDV